MTIEPDNSPEEGVTDNDVELSQSDTPEDLPYYDPEEDDLDNVAEEEAEGTDDEADEDDSEDVEGDGQEEGDQEAEDEAEPQTLTMDDGTEVAIDELKKGYLRQSDYTRKAQHLANETKAHEAEVQRMTRITDTFVEYLSNLIPEEPDAALAYQDAAKYTAMKAQHDQSVAQVQKLIAMADEAKEAQASITEADKRKQLEAANAQLAEMFPETTQGEGRKAFFTGVQTVANDLGFSNDELSSLTDPRIFALAHWARKGMDAEKAVKAAKTKARKAPPATPRKPGKAAGTGNRNAEAMQKLRQDDSIENAIAALSG